EVRLPACRLARFEVGGQQPQKIPTLSGINPLAGCDATQAAPGRDDEPRDVSAVAFHVHRIRVVQEIYATADQRRGSHDLRDGAVDEIPRGSAAPGDVFNKARP